MKSSVTTKQINDSARINIICVSVTFIPYMLLPWTSRKRLYNEVSNGLEL